MVKIFKLYIIRKRLFTMSSKCQLTLVPKDPLSDVRQFLTTESPFKMMKNAFYFMLKALFVLQIFKFLSWLFGYVEKRYDKKVNLNPKIYDVADWTTGNYNTHIAQYFKK